MSRKIKVYSTEDTFGLGIDFQRCYLNEYSWWEHELHITLGNKIIEVYFNAKGLPNV